MGNCEEAAGDAICCLLHNLVPGGSARQWIHLLGRHVKAGGRATVVAPPGQLAEPARTAGIAVVPFTWDDSLPLDWGTLAPVVEEHDTTIVHWDHAVMGAFVPALEAGNRTALVLHQAPHALTRWFGAAILPSARIPLVRAVEDRRAVALVRGECHRRRIATAFDIPAGELDVLPASIPLDSVPFRPVSGEPQEILALMRLSPDKAAIGQLAIEVTRAGLATGRSCRLVIAGDGPWRTEAIALCKRRLPPGVWRIESAPRDPVVRLAAAQLVVSQGLTTLEAAALGRLVIVARELDESRAAGVVLTPDSYYCAASDPFGEPPLTPEADRLWEEALAIQPNDLCELRHLVEANNSLDISARALGKAIATTQ